MSKLSLAPNYVSCTVIQARNLPNKGKTSGIDPFCTIGMGKEKFVTAVREKTSTPDWHEQCDMPIVDDATIKLTVYHNTKSSLSKGEFIGRAYVSLRDLHDYDHVHTNWYKLSNKEGKMDKDRGEIEVSLQFYSKNNNTGSVLDLSTKKKHLSLKDIKQSLRDKVKSAKKHPKDAAYGGQNQLADQRRQLEGASGSVYSVPDFLDDSISDVTSNAGSQFSLNSMSNKNSVGQPKKISQHSNASFGSNLPTIETPRSSHRSITSDYETSSILDSASMGGGDESFLSSPPPSTTTKKKTSTRELHPNDELPPKVPSSQKTRNKQPVPSITLPTIITTQPSNPPTTSPHALTAASRSSSITADDVEAAFDAVQNEETVFGLSTIKENLDTNGNRSPREDEIDFDSYFRPTNGRKSPSSKGLRSIFHTKEQTQVKLNQSDEIPTPLTSLVFKIGGESLQTSDVPPDDVDEDVEELLGKLERISSIRSSVKRKVQPKEDIMQQSFSENETRPGSGFQSSPSQSSLTHRLPDIVGERTGKNMPSSSVPTIVKPVNQGLSVLGYQDVKSTPINPKIRQELDYLDREELLHVIAHQCELLKRRDTRVKDLEGYTDGLLVKIVEQCPTILQNGTIKSQKKY